MPPEVQSFSISSWGSDGSIEITKPTDLAEGDLMVASCVADQWDPGADFSAPDVDWSTLDPFNIVGGGYMRIFWKIADAADVAETTFVFTASGFSVPLEAGGMLRIDGHDPDNPIQSSGSANQNSGVSDPSPDYSISITPTDNNLLLFFIGASDDWTASNQSFGSDSVAEAWDTTTTASTDFGFSCAYGPKATGAAITSESATLTGSGSVFSGAFLVSITPPVVASTSSSSNLLMMGV